MTFASFTPKSGSLNQGHHDPLVFERALSALINARQCLSRAMWLTDERVSKWANLHGGLWEIPIPIERILTFERTVSFYK